MRELILSSGPDRYFGGTIETFALPYGASETIKQAAPTAGGQQEGDA